MSDIVERLRELSRWLLAHDVDMEMPAGMIDPAEAADTITALRAEIERLRAGLNEKEKRGIYIASKTKHAARWRYLRDKIGEPIISTWIDEAGEGESKDLSDLWHRCILEASTAKVLILYREKDEVLKGAWVELGAALACRVPVFAIGIEEYTIATDVRIKHFRDMKSAIAASRSLLTTQEKR